MNNNIDKIKNIDSRILKYKAYLQDINKYDKNEVNKLKFFMKLKCSSMPNCEMNRKMVAPAQRKL